MAHSHHPDKVVELFAPSRNRLTRRSRSRQVRPPAPSAGAGHGERNTNRQAGPAAMAPGSGQGPAVLQRAEQRSSLPAEQALVLDLFGQPAIAFHRVYVDVAGGCVKAALWLSHAIALAARQPGAPASLEMTTQDCLEATGLSRREQETARAKLRGLGLIAESHGWKKRNRFEIQFEQLGRLLLELSERRWKQDAVETGTHA